MKIESCGRASKARLCNWVRWPWASVAIVLVLMCGSVATAGTRFSSQRELAQALLTMKTVDEGVVLLERNSHLVDFWFFANIAQELDQLGAVDLQQALLINEVLTRSVYLLRHEEERKNALGWCLASRAGLELDQGRQSEAQRLYKQALALFTTPPEHLPGMAATYSNLAYILVVQGRDEAALKMLEESAALYRTMRAPLGEAKARRDIGMLHSRGGRYAEAEAAFDLAFDLIRRFLTGPVGPELTIYARQALATIYRTRAEMYTTRRLFDKAIADLREAGSIYISVQDPIGLLNTFCALGSVSTAWGRLDDAVTYLRAAEEGARRVLERHPHALAFRSVLAQSQLGLGNTYAQQARYQLAKAKYLAALQLFEQMADKRGAATVQLNLGLTLAETSRYDEAATQIQTALRAFTSLNDWGGVVRCYLALASIKTARYDYDTAQRLYSQVQTVIEDQAIGDPSMRATLFLGLGNLHFQQGDFATAESYYISALDLYERLDALEAAHVQINIANLYAARGLLDEALRVCQLALDRLSKVHDPRALAAVYLCRGSVRLNKGLPNGALEDLANALELAKQVEDPMGMIQAYLALGRAYHSLGRPADALRHYESALEVCRSIGHSVKLQAYAYQGIGGVYASLGDHQKAHDNYSAALHLLDQIQDRQLLGACYTNIGSLYIALRKYEAAESYLLFAKTVLQEGGQDTTLVLLTLGYLYKQMGFQERAGSCLAQALEFARKAGNTRLEALVSLYLAEFEFDRGNLPIALEHYDQAYKLFFDMGAVYELARVSTGIGRVLEMGGEHHDALNAYKSAIEYLEEARAQMQIEELKLGWPWLARDTYVRAVGLLVAMNEVDESLSYAERSKARTLVDLMAKGWGSFQAAVPQALVHKEFELISEIAMLEAELRAEWQRPQTQRRPRLIEELEEILEQKKQEYTVLLIEMKLKVPQYAMLRGVSSEQVSLQQQVVVADLGAGEVVVEFFVTREATFVWVVTKGGVQAASRIPIPREKLVERVRAFREELNEAPKPGEEAARELQVRGLGKELYDLLIAPIEHYIQTASHLVIVPSDVLFYVPFGALFRCPGCQTKRDLWRGEYLVQHYSISYTPSLASLYRPFQQRGDGVYESVLAVGNPTGDLAYAAKEAEAVASLFPRGDPPLLRDAGTKDRVLALLRTKQYDVIHLSTHGEFDRVLPLLSRILFYGKEMLYAGEILGLSLPVELVVLSACQTGLPPEVTEELVLGDELHGLSQALFVAGVPSAVLTLWNVNDRSTSYFMVGMYQRLMAGASKGESLRQAQLAFLTDETRLYRHPYFWAPFVLYGVWR